MTTYSLDTGVTCSEGHGCYLCHRAEQRRINEEASKDAAGPILVLLGLTMGGFILFCAWLSHPHWALPSMLGVLTVGQLFFFCGAVLQTLTVGGLVQIWIRWREKWRRPAATA